MGPTQTTSIRSRDPDAGLVCVSIRRGGQFWRFACDRSGVRELFERLAELADREESSLDWDDAELIAAQVLSNQTPDRGQPGTDHDR
ncbi:MAG: hypothetical protein AAGA55_03085 [Planctomycetota bacterium]